MFRWGTKNDMNYSEILGHLFSPHHHTNSLWPYFSRHRSSRRNNDVQRVLYFNSLHRNKHVSWKADAIEKEALIQWYKNNKAFKIDSNPFCRAFTSGIVLGELDC